MSDLAAETSPMAHAMGYRAIAAPRLDYEGLRSGDFCALASLGGLEIVLNHLFDQILKGIPRFPTQDAARLRRIANQFIHLGRAIEILVADDKVSIVEFQN